MRFSFSFASHPLGTYHNIRYLQKQLSRKVGNREYAKYVVVIPPSIINELGWKDRENLTATVNGKELVIKPKGVLR